jgi:hypothetical protein
MKLFTRVEREKGIKNKKKRERKWLQAWLKKGGRKSALPLVTLPGVR